MLAIQAPPLPEEVTITLVRRWMGEDKVNNKSEPATGRERERIREQNPIWKWIGFPFESFRVIVFKNCVTWIWTLSLLSDSPTSTVFRHLLHPPTHPDVCVYFLSSSSSTWAAGYPVLLLVCISFCLTCSPSPSLSSIESFFFAKLKVPKSAGEHVDTYELTFTQLNSFSFHLHHLLSSTFTVLSITLELLNYPYLHKI